MESTSNEFPVNIYMYKPQYRNLLTNGYLHKFYASTCTDVLTYKCRGILHGVILYYIISDAHTGTLSPHFLDDDNYLQAF